MILHWIGWETSVVHSRNSSWEGGCLLQWQRRQQVRGDLCYWARTTMLVMAHCSHNIAPVQRYYSTTNMPLLWCRRLSVTTAQQNWSNLIYTSLAWNIRCSWVHSATGLFVTAKGRTATWGQKPVPSELRQATQGPVAGLWLRCWEDETCCLSFASCFSTWDLRLLGLSLSSLPNTKYQNYIVLTVDLIEDWGDFCSA